MSFSQPVAKSILNSIGEEAGRRGSGAYFQQIHCLAWLSWLSCMSCRGCVRLVGWLVVSLGCAFTVRPDGSSVLVVPVRYGRMDRQHRVLAVLLRYGRMDRLSWLCLYGTAGCIVCLGCAFTVRPDGLSASCLGFAFTVRPDGSSVLVVPLRYGRMDRQPGVTPRAAHGFHAFGL